MNRDVLRDLFHLVWQWWTGDRIRVSPVEGRLLRVLPGDILSVDGTDVEVVDRIVIAERTLCLICRTQRGTAELYVPVFSKAGPQEIVWVRSGGERTLTTADIEVWPRGHRRKVI